MAGKTLNAKNLQALGSERLAELVMDLVQGSAPLKREARAALLEAAGSEALAGEVRKRLAAIKRSQSRVSWRKRKAFLRDLTNQRDIITTRIAPDNPVTAHDLLWQFLEMSDQIFYRTSDEQGDFALLFEETCEGLGPIAIAAKIEPDKLADRVFTAFTDQSGYGVFDRLIGQMQGALAEPGIAALKTRFTNALDDPEWDGDAVLRIGLMIIADLEGDADGYAVQYDAARLVMAERADEALVLLDTADIDDGLPVEWVDARIETLDALGRGDDAQHMRWQAFLVSFSPTYLRDYVQHLPDFEDVEAEDRGLDHVVENSPVHQALLFLIEWPALDRAAKFVMAERQRQMR